MRKTLYTIIASLFALSLLIFTSCLDGEINGSAQVTGTRVVIGFPTAQCLDRSASRDVSTEQSILDCVVLFTLTITDSFDPIVETFAIGDDITVLVPVGSDRNFMIEGTDENGDLCCSGGVTADVFPGENTIEITCIPVPTPTPTPTPTPIPTPTPMPTSTPPPTPPPTPIPTPSPTPVPTPTPTPMACETDAQCPPGQICESGMCVPGCRSSDDCPQGEVCIFVNDIGMCVPVCGSDEDCPPGEICEPVGPFETSICVPGCRNDFDCPPGKICDEGNMCVPGCNEAKPCPGNQVCVQGMCLPGPQVPPEVCNDGLDNDGDGHTDCADSDCIGQSGPCEGTCEQPETTCFDGFDNDGDGAVDCDDPDCFRVEGCSGPDCIDGIDNDGDGLADCADPDCAAAAAICQFPEATCFDEFDNDGDGLIDCADSDCFGDENCPIIE